MNAAMTLILACVGIFGFFILLLGFILIMRYISYQEKVKMADKGVYIQEEPMVKPKKGLLIAGLIVTFIGIFGTILFWIFGVSVTGSGMGNYFPLGFGPWMLLGLFPLLLGLILLLIYVLRFPSGNLKLQQQDHVSMNDEAGSDADDDRVIDFQEEEKKI
ncbi:MAG TPA: hypothetical protein VK856_15745 [Anaerolineaceae bacterium]|nr:hypothetical protein [Anaerolineaceae bacterium]